MIVCYAMIVFNNMFLEFLIYLVLTQLESGCRGTSSSQHLLVIGLTLIPMYETASPYTPQTTLLSTDGQYLLAMYQLFCITSYVVFHVLVFASESYANLPSYIFICSSCCHMLDLFCEFLKGLPTHSAINF